MGQMFGKKHEKKCCCAIECCGRCVPLNCLDGTPNVCANPLPVTLTCDLTATPSFGSFTCFNGSGTLTFLTALDGGICCWEGRISGTCVDCNGVTFNWYVDIVTCCSAAGWTVSSTPGLPCVQGDAGSDAVVAATVCDPVLLDGCFVETIDGCVVACIMSMPPTSGPSYTLCFQIYETP